MDDLHLGIDWSCQQSKGPRKALRRNLLVIVYGRVEELLEGKLITHQAQQGGAGHSMALEWMDCPCFDSPQDAGEYEDDKRWQTR